MPVSARRLCQSQLEDYMIEATLSWDDDTDEIEDPNPPTRHPRQAKSLVTIAVRCPVRRPSMKASRAGSPPELCR
eukprot:scaffold20212_cov54-Attheya_sp.AAC.6